MPTQTFLSSVNRSGNDNKYNTFVAAQKAGTLDETSFNSLSFVVPNNLPDQMIITMPVAVANQADLTKVAVQIDLLIGSTWQSFCGFTTEGPYTETPSLGLDLTLLKGKTIRIRSACSANIRFSIVGSW